MIKISYVQNTLFVPLRIFYQGYVTSKSALKITMVWNRS